MHEEHHILLVNSNASVVLYHRPRYVILSEFQEACGFEELFVNN